VRLYINLKLDSGGCVNISGEELTAEDVAEVFDILSGKSVESAWTASQSIDVPLPTVCMIPACGCDGTPHP
jgi:hypothetical protein